MLVLQRPSGSRNSIARNRAPQIHFRSAYLITSSCRVSCEYVYKCVCVCWVSGSSLEHCSQPNTFWNSSQPLGPSRDLLGSHEYILNMPKSSTSYHYISTIDSMVCTKKCMCVCHFRITSKCECSQLFNKLWAIHSIVRAPEGVNRRTNI